MYTIYLFQCIVILFITVLLLLCFYSLTSIKSFPKDFCMGLRTISADLEHLKIGNCDFLLEGFQVFLKKLSNLRSLRLENFQGGLEKYAKENFDAIRSLKKLKKLELINIEFNDCVKQQLEKCDGLTALLIIPVYVCQVSIIQLYFLTLLLNPTKTIYSFSLQQSIVA